ncbi:hypothetical protein SmJEL517_g03101 [Synchytrium microbalum]|uniref:Ribosome assembly factor mrt4 n=1 Tax=Synchytrium microbalum TaxID=1806994 RepID=A0A507C857_9FUNG|nr:uncharacterized protein SmJEL517_g03101 [Synchytrium microbalum]TPX34204.1 hypothetical protein SmJEL517_g03101 [Synchytrium microbalum]
MAKSRREKKVSLTRTTKKGRGAKENLFQQIRDCLEKHHDVYVLSVHNMRANVLKDVRAQLPESRLFFGRNKVMAKALGTTEAEEYRVGLRHVAENLVGQVGLLFTSEKPERIKEFFDSFSEIAYARSGALAVNTVTVPAGTLTLPHSEAKIPHSLEPQFRKLGLPTAMVNGLVTLTQEYRICEGGKPLTPEAAQLLKHLQIPMAEFRVTLLARWNDGAFEQMVSLDEAMAEPVEEEGAAAEGDEEIEEEEEVEE